MPFDRKAKAWKLVCTECGKSRMVAYPTYWKATHRGKGLCMDCNGRIGGERIAQYKHTPDDIEKMRQSLIGRPTWNRGRKGLQKNHNLSGLELGRGWNRGYKGFLAGETHYNWKGGVSRVAKLLWETVEYQQWRATVFERDDWTCQACRQRGNALEAHHKHTLNSLLKENAITTVKQARACTALWNTANGETLCKACHVLTFKGKPKYAN
jgi:hypothetical protein